MRSLTVSLEPGSVNDVRRVGDRELGRVAGDQLEEGVETGRGEGRWNECFDYKTFFLARAPLLAFTNAQTDQLSF